MAATAPHIADLFQSQKDYFATGETRPYAFRKAQIKKLRGAIQKHEEKILHALAEDMGKPEFEAFGSEVGFMYAEISHCLASLRDWMEPESVSTSIAHFPTRSTVHSVPKGQVLILSPWNYPFQLLMNPLLAAMAAGNTAVLKLPWQTPSTSAVVKEIISETFPSNYVACVSIEDQEIIPQLIEGLRFDQIFFTGSERVGKLILKAAADQLIPVTLELGGKSPAIVDNTADLKVSARRIIWGKAFNAGQTCIAPDHVLVHKEVKSQLLYLLEKEADAFMENYGGLDGFPRIVNVQRFETLLGLLEGVEEIHGGDLDADALKLGLCVVDEPGMDSRLMKEEIFGPILPVIGYEDEEDLMLKMSQNPTPLALYLFSSDKKAEKQIMERVSFGGSCINNCLIHFANPDAPFGGIGSSGMGSYHSKAGFDTFSHKRSILKTSTWLDIPIRYAPYDKWKMKILRLIFR